MKTLNGSGNSSRMIRNLAAFQIFDPNQGYVNRIYHMKLGKGRKQVIY